MKITIATCLLGCLLASTARADIVDKSANVEQLATVPPSVKFNDLRSDAFLRVFEETETTTSSQLSVGLAGPAGPILPAGTRVRTFFLHNARENGELTRTYWVRFDEPIFGVFKQSDQLNASEAALFTAAADLARYPNGGARGLEEADSASVSADRRTLTLTLKTGNNFGDQVRVVFLANDIEPPQDPPSGCPCNNDPVIAGGQPVTGCVNSTGLGGLLTIQGSTTEADNALSMTMSQLPRGTFGILFVGTSQAAQPLPLGDGLLVAQPGPPGDGLGHGFMRYPIQLSGPGGTISRGDLVQYARNQLGGFQAGQAYVFQGYYRNPRNGCNGFNLTNPVRVTFR